MVVGVVVLRSGAAQAEVGWFSYDGPPPPEVLDRLVAWNETRVVGAVLVVAGLVVLAHLLGVVAGRGSPELAARLAGPALVLAGLFVVGGVVAFFVAETAPVGTGSSAWTQNQTATALIAATGLVVGAVGTGLRRTDAP